MRAGELDRKIVIQSSTPTRDDYGGEVQGWSTYATVWAKFTPLRGTERFAAQQPVAVIAGTFRLYWLAGVDETMRISHDGQYWDIRSINEIGRREGLEIFAEVKRA